MTPEIKDTALMPDGPGAWRVVGAWLLVVWMVAVCSLYAYFMLRSFL